MSAAAGEDTQLSALGRKGTTIAVGVLAVAFIGIWLSDRPKCDSVEAVAKLKSMALEAIRTKSIFRDPAYRNELVVENLTIDSFSKRGEVGRTGSSCAAQINVHGIGGTGWIDEFSVDYTIEPTTDGKTMMSARFRPSPREASPY
jgi:hypothetical protein